MPRIPTFKRDLAAADIPFEDVRGRRIDLHGPRKTYGTMLATAGVSPQVAMKLMRHSNMKLAMGVYTDVAQLPMIGEAARLSSLTLPQPVAVSNPAAAESSEKRAQLRAQRDAQTGIAASPGESSPDATGQTYAHCNALKTGALGHKKAPCDITGRFLKMERAKRLELSTSSLARKCSTN